MDKLKLSADNSPLVNVIREMHTYIRKVQHISYYSSSKYSGIRPEVIKMIEEDPMQGRSKSLLALLVYYRENYGEVFADLIKRHYHV